MLELQSSMRFLAQDLSQAVPRPVRDSNGSGEEPAFWVDARRDVLLRLTRGGWRNSAQLQRSQLQRVHYLLDNGALIRLEWPVTDATQATVPRRRILLTELRGVRVRLMNRARQWQDSWPAATAVANSARTLRERPIAVEVVLETNDLGELRRVFEVPG
jgi:general secretion pathway protein J